MDVRDSNGNPLADGDSVRVVRPSQAEFPKQS
ncbi:MAG: PhnA domain-containing protein [Gemmatirosa sp.]